jgi:hypothetical protein
MEIEFNMVAWAALCISLVVAVFNIRKAVREFPKLRIHRADANAVYAGLLRWDFVAASVINEGGTTVSITDYAVEVYENKWMWVVGRPTRIVTGNGRALCWNNNAVSNLIPGGTPQAVPLKSGEPITLKVYDHGFWPDKRWRAVYVTVRYSPPRKTARLRLKPNEYNYSDPEFVAFRRKRLVEEDNFPTVAEPNQRPPHYYEGVNPPN